MGKKMKNLWKLKRKGVGKMILEKKEEEFKVEWSRSESWKNKKEEDGDGEFFVECGRNYGRLMKGMRKEEEIW